MSIFKYICAFILFYFSSRFGLVDQLWRGGPLNIPEATVLVAFGSRLISEIVFEFCAYMMRD